MVSGSPKPPTPQEQGEPGRASASWLELFYDLVLVAATIVLAAGYSANVSWENAGWLSGMFALLWWCWFTTTELTNRDRSDSASRRVLVLVQMFVIMVFTVVGGNAVHTHDARAGAVAGVLMLTVAALAEEIRRQVPELGAMARVRRNAFVLGGVLAIVGAAVPSQGQVVAWSLAGLVILVPVVVPRFEDPVARSRADTSHLVERFGLLTMIVLGESFVEVAITATEHRLAEINFFVLGLEFLIIFALWLSYFDDIARAGPTKRLGGRKVWLVSHMPLHLAIVAMAVGLAKWETLQITSQPSGLDVRLFTGPLVAIYLLLAVIGLSSARHPRLPLLGARITTCLLLVAVGGLAQYANAVSVEVAMALYGAVALIYTGVAEWLRTRSTVDPAR